ncbi:MFS transporter [Pseudohaliea sp.]|uniref:spinster family MFS transporter n=1 Tax=Pseudohaliea sp. TaxID=2740289 RepID=UPI0032EE9C08
MTLLLTVVFVFSFVDRQILNLLVGPIQQDLDLNDTQVSLLQGFGFVATYVLLSIPIGRLVDTRRRISIIAFGVAFWSLATAACGLARSFTGLFIARAGVGVGEATLTPAAWSLLADYFPPHRRSLPFSVFLMGPYLGVGIAMIAGGLVMEGLSGNGQLELPLLGSLAPWQATFFAVAAPGILLTVMLLFVPEPSRKGLAAGTEPEAASFRDIIAWVSAHHRVYVALLIGVPCIVLVLYGLQAWIPTYLLRVHGMSLGEAGTQYGTIALFAGSLGVLSGPFVGRYLERRGHSDYPLRVCVLALALIGPGLAALAFAPSATLALCFIAVVSYLVPLPLALVAAALQNATPNQMRGVLVGTYVVTTNVVGMALGPSLVAVATDYLFVDPTAVGKSLALVGVVVSLLGMYLIGRALAAYRALLDNQGVAS